MNTLHSLLNFILHLDEKLTLFVTSYGAWVYGLLTLIIFCETAIVFLPFLPGDSLIFAAGALASRTDSFNVHLLFILLTAASIIGNGINYFIGRFLGVKLFNSNQSWLFNKKYLDKTHEFFERYGGKAVLIARFIPIIRTFVPFVAGMGYMNYRRFFAYNAIGAIIWIGCLIYVSYLFGNIPIIKEHFMLVILTIVIISILPPIIEFWRHPASSKNLLK